jgi:hypothetical protein
MRRMPSGGDGHLVANSLLHQLINASSWGLWSISQLKRFGQQK